MLVVLQGLQRKSWYLRSKNYSCLITALTAAETQAFTLFKKLMRDPDRNTKKICDTEMEAKTSSPSCMFFTRKNCKQEKQDF